MTNTTLKRARDLADKLLNVKYNLQKTETEPKAWRVDYHLPDQSVIGVHTHHDGQLAKAQIRGMLAHFAVEFLEAETDRND